MAKRSSIEHITSISDQTITEYLPLVISIAKRYTSRRFPIDDLIGEGTVGLMEAARRYDPSNGATLGTYARPYIEKYILLALKQRNPTDSISLDAHPALKDAIEDPVLSTEEVVCNNELREELLTAMDACLTERQRLIITMRYLNEMSQTEVARHLSISQPSVARLEKRALTKLREKMGGYEF
jgi:RNA polymerase sigma-E/F/G factor